MDAVVYAAPGELRLDEVPVPTPSPGEVIVEVAYLGVCGSDLLIWDGGLERVIPPVVMGHEFSGTVVDANGCPGVAEGDRVAIEPLLNCAECAACLRDEYNLCIRLRLLGIDVDGGAARYVAVPAHRLHGLSDGVSLRDAALVEPTAVAVHMARRAGVDATTRVLVVGGGPIGALVAIVARALGAPSVIVSEPNLRRRAVLQAFDLATFDPIGREIAELRAEAGDEGFDVVFELTGIQPGLDAAIECARSGGVVLLGGLPHAPLQMPVATAVLKELTLRGSRVYRGEDVELAIEYIADGAVSADRLVTREVGLAEAIDGAYRPLRSSRDDMKILITPNRSKG